MEKAKYSETLRKLVHLGYGLFLAVLVSWFEKPLSLFLLGSLLLTGGILSKFHGRIPFARSILERLERRNAPPGKGALAMTLGAFVAAAVFDPVKASLGIAFLAVGDSAATLVGRRAGRTKVLGEKSLEGSLAFFVAAALTGFSLFGGFAPGALLLSALAGALAELVPSDYLDDNILIPVVCAAFLL